MILVPPFEFSLVRENFLVTRHLREYLALMIGLTGRFRDRITLDGGGAHE